MRNLSMNPRNGRLQKSIAAGVIAFLALTIALIFWPNAITTLTGISHRPQLSAPDDLSAATKDDLTSFLAERDQIEIKVAEATTLREFLDRNRLNKQSQVKQIAAQLGSDLPTTPIAAGTIFRIRLTPGAEDVPGVAPRKR